jgi:hypothetical protein
VQARLAQVPALVLERHGLVGAEQLHDDVGALLEQQAGRALIEPDHGGVGGERARTHAQHEPAPHQVIEQHRSLGDHVRVVIAHRHHTGAQLDVAGALGGRRDEDLRRGDDLAAGRVVLTDPGLVVAELVEVLDQVEISLQRPRRVLSGRVERGHEDPESQSVAHS